MKNRGYVVPDPIDPENTACIRVYVPNHQLYIAAFMRAYTFFGEWVAWERDPSGKAKLAAAVWRDAIERTQSEFDCAEGECGIMDIRQKSGAPCVIEKLAGCGEEWSEAVDMRLCVPRMRIRNGVIQQDISGNGDWVDSVNAETETYDPRFDAPSTPAWTTPPSGETGECLSAANVSEYIGWASTTIAAEMVGGLSFFQILSAAITILAAVTDLVPISILTAGITQVYTLVIDNWEGVRDFSIVSRLTDILHCRYNEDGSMSAENWALVKDDIQTERASLESNNQRAKWQIAYILVDLWGPVGMTVLGAIWGISSYECNDNCGYDVTYTFSESDHGWDCNYSNEWRTGCLADYSADGWHSVSRDNGGVSYEVLQMWKETAHYNLTYYEVNYTISANNPFANGLGLWYGASSTDRNYVSNGTFADGTYTALWQGNHDGTHIGFDAEGGNTSDIRVNWIRIKGSH